MNLDEYGHLIPQMLTREDGRRFRIDRVTNVRQAAAMRACGQSDRYTVWINGIEVILFRAQPESEKQQHRTLVRRTADRVN